MSIMAPINTADLHRIFNKLDKNSDGLVCLEELTWFLEKIGLQTSPDELEQLVGKKCLDPIDFVFFHDTIIKGREINADEGDDILEKDLLKAFKIFDLDGDGYICSEELQSSLSRFGLWDEKCGKDCNSMIAVYDSNSDGKLDFEEFKNMMLLSNN